eukprot:CAMPEP_0173423308 /NCGR_PEP_ID=MMETSP1357-20121228/3664_1 /TAXON_ID=77926 /ORGANISM="Hemiselmis rufescens, Strain PCC563" /LENGTH=240 /DNA_ID=CAMNT_0014386407 /DNA_START=24 /DNA_END=746 /DNA_ORIENTATION=+
MSLASQLRGERVDSEGMTIHDRIEMLEALNATLVRHLHTAGWQRQEEEEEVARPRTELVGSWWELEGWRDAPVTDASIHGEGEDVHVSRCAGSGASMQLVNLMGECKFVCVEDCQCLHLTVEMISKAMLVLRCTKCILVIGGRVPSVTLRDCISVEVVIGDSSCVGGIETVGCHGIVITTVPQANHSMLTVQQLHDSMNKNSVAVPERLTTSLVNGNMLTTCSANRGQSNSAHHKMAHIR